MMKIKSMALEDLGLRAAYIIEIKLKSDQEMDQIGHNQHTSHCQA